jgi:hypothetical protein
LCWWGRGNIHHFKIMQITIMEGCFWSSNLHYSSGSTAVT